MNLISFNIKKQSFHSNLGKILRQALPRASADAGEPSTTHALTAQNSGGKRFQPVEATILKASVTPHNGKPACLSFRKRNAARPSKKLADALFCREARFACSPAAGRAAKRVRKALLSRAAEPDVHAAGFGMKIRRPRPSDTS